MAGLEGLIDRFHVLTFDCYGTLIDWERGILSALGPVLVAHGLRPDRDDVLRLYAEAEAKAEAGAYVRYREVLVRVVRDIGDELGFSPSRSELTCLSDSLGTWPRFPDTVDALRRLKQRYRLAVISNVDDDLFGQSERLLGVQFDWVITSERARSYKPSRNNFKLAIETIGAPAEAILHVAESLRHDIAPAVELGLSTVRVDRRRNDQATRASGDSAATHIEADFVVPDLATLASALAPASDVDVAAARDR